MSALLLALLLQAAPAHPAPHGAEAAASSVPVATAEAPGPAAEHAAAEDPAAVIINHSTDKPLAIGPAGAPWIVLPSKHFVFFLIAAAIVILFAQLGVRSYRGGRIPRGVGAAVEGLLLFVRDQIAEPNIGHGDGRRFAPLLCSFFVFILVAALLGLMPFAATSTGNLAVTMALALVSFAAQQYAGISNHGLVGHFRNLVPPGLPLWLVPIMIPVEILSMFTKPFALMIRLFANMLAGHMVITTLLLLIALMGQISWLGGVAMAPVSILLALFIMFLEILVAFIQAYIFTLLSAVFIGLYAHPAH